MKRLRILVLMHADLVPPEPPPPGQNVTDAEWKTEYDVVTTLRQLGHDVKPLGVKSDLGVLRAAIEDWKPHIAFNLLEEFDGVAVYDQNVVSYLELLHVPYTGCNPRGLMLARDKVLAKKLFSFHRIPFPDFMVVPQGRRVKRPAWLAFPLIVKSVTEEASLGISQASIVQDDDKLKERVAFIHASVGTGALIEQYIEGRELYVGVLGNGQVHVLPVWELLHGPAAGGRPSDRDRTGQMEPGVSREVRDSLRRSAAAAGGESRGDATSRQAGLSRPRPERLCAHRCADGRGGARVSCWKPIRIPRSRRTKTLRTRPRKPAIPMPALLQELLNIGLRWQPAKAA